MRFVLPILCVASGIFGVIAATLAIVSQHWILLPANAGISIGMFGIVIWMAGEYDKNTWRK